MSTRTPNNRSGANRAKRRPLARLRDARIRSKLSLILVVPVVTILGLATLRLVDSGQRALEADLVRSLTALSADVSRLSHELHRERMAAATYLVDLTSAPDGFTRQTRRTEEATARYTRARAGLGDVPAGVADQLRRVDEHLTTLNATRQEVLDRRGVSFAQVLVRYGVVIDDLVSYREEVGQVAGDNALADALRAVAAFSKAKAQVSEEQAIAYAALKSGQLDSEEHASFLATLTSQQEAFVAFRLAANAQQRALVETTVTGDALELAGRMATELSRSLNGTATVKAEEVSSAVGAVTDLMRWTEERLDGDVLASAVALRTSVIRRVVIESGVVLITLILAVAFALLLARSMARSLGRLREGALAVAHKDLPAAVARLRDVQTLGENSPDEIARQVRDPIALANRDEIGQVGQAFNVVHREAVRVAAEQAALRTSVSAMFLNLARRSQTLVDRMIGELDQIERGEEDPKRLAQLFQLDHLATRMRRNDENLLVLAGADSSPPRRDDALLVDALRAAQSEVELYDRIEFGTVDTDVSIASHAVNDVVRLLAELLDNATRFSPPNTIIVADARRIGDYVLVQVEDHGLGLSDEQLNVLNERLAAPSTVDVAAFRMMGLAVVARLAGRYQIRVELRRNAEGGTVANVALPSSILVLPKIRGREPLVARPRPLAVETTPYGARGWQPPVPDTVPSSLAGWGATANADPVAVGLHVTGAAASAAAAAGHTSMPVAGRGGTVDGYPVAAPAATVPGLREDTTELPIFREIEAAWFRTHGPLSTDGWSSAAPVAPASGPPAAYPPLAPHAPPVSHVPQMPSPVVSAPPAYGPAYVAPSPAAAPPPAYAVPPPAYATPDAYSPPPVPPPAVPVGADASPGIPRPREAERDWRTLADSGWQAASAASVPQAAGTTRSGLPKRMPGGQLVPGAVDQSTAQSKSRRTPEEVRGLLSAYHRGVQRGRTGGEAAKNDSDAFKGSNG